MVDYNNLSKNELLELEKDLEKRYAEYVNLNLNLDMSRGKPGPSQLDLSDGLLDRLDSYKTEAGLDVRNYGVLDGIPEIKKIFADLLGLKEENIIIGGNSSLNLMYDQLTRLFLFGTLGNKPWSKLERVKFLCPCPGYDRHFTMLNSVEE